MKLWHVRTKDLVERNEFWDVWAAPTALEAKEMSVLFYAREWGVEYSQVNVFECNVVDGPLGSRFKVNLEELREEEREGE